MVSNNTGIYPNARGVVQTFKDAENPLDFIRNNIRPTTDPDVEVRQIVAKVEQARTEEQPNLKPTREILKDVAVKALEAVLQNKKEEAQVPSESPVEPQTSPNAVAKEVPAEEELPTSSEEESASSQVEGEDLDDPDTQGLKPNVADNFKKLRKSFTEAKQKLTEYETKTQELESTVERYKKGEVLPETLVEKEKEINRLTRYEKIFNLKGSSEYQDKYVKPLNEIRGTLRAIAKDYNLPESLMDKALNLGNRAERNRFLAAHFDDVGALEVKQLIEKAQGIHREAQEAEKEPETALNTLLEESEAAKVAKIQAARDTLAKNTRSAWVESLDEFSKTGGVIGLTPKEGDDEYNKNFVEPVIAAASVEYGKLVRMLADNGLEKLPPDLAKALAKTVQLAHASAVSLEYGKAAVAHADKIEQNTKRTANFIRPPIGGSSGLPRGTSTAANRTPLDPRMAAEQLLDMVMNKKR